MSHLPVISGPDCVRAVERAGSVSYGRWGATSSCGATSHSVKLSFRTTRRWIAEPCARFFAPRGLLPIAFASYCNHRHNGCFIKGRICNGAAIPPAARLLCFISVFHNEAVKYGYARTSTGDQTTALQLAALKKARCAHIFEDQGLSGANARRPALRRCLKTLRAGDTLVVWKLDRLARSLRDLIAMLDDLQERGVRFQSLTESIDTQTPTGRAMWQMIGVLAELERSLIAERTRAGVKAAQRRGIQFGRKRKLSAAQLAHARELIDKGEARSYVASLLNVSRVTLYRALL